MTGEELQLTESHDRPETAEWLPPDAPTDSSHDEIARRREDLHRAMIRLEASVARSRKLDDWRQVVEEALAGIQHALQRHIREVESENGLLNEVVARSPRLSAAAESLRDEHRELEEAVWASQAVAGTHGVDPSQVRAEAMEVITRLANHRQTGADLLYDAYSLDLGGED